MYKDQGNVNLQAVKRINIQKRTHSVFIGDAPPHVTLQALKWLKLNEPATKKQILKKRFRNAKAVLSQLGMIRQEGGKFYVANFVKESNKKLHELIWEAAKDDQTLQKVVEYINEHPNAKGVEIGRFINDKFQRNWSAGSIIRTGGSLRRWGTWILYGIDTKDIPIPVRKRYDKKVGKVKQLSMF